MKHDDQVMGALLTKDERRILSWCNDDTLRLWDATTGQQIGLAMEHRHEITGAVNGALLTKDERRILSWSDDGTLRLWLEDAIAIAESAVDAGADELRIEAGFDNRAEFDQAAAEAKPRTHRPWLKKVEENGKEVVRVIRWADATKSSGSLAQPTADELAHGQFFEDRDAYDRANAGLPGPAGDRAGSK